MKSQEKYRPYNLSEDSGELFRAFADQNIDGVLLINPELNVVTCNHALEEITGLNAKDIIGIKAWELQMRMIPKEKRTPEAQDRFKNIFLQMIQSGIIPDYLAYNESPVYRVDGKYIIAEQKIFAIQSMEGYWLGVLARDITENKRAEKQIQQQAARAEIMAAFSQLLIQVNQDYQLVLDTVVRKCAELIGDGASVFSYSPGSEFLELAAVYNPKPEAIEIFKNEVEARPIRADEGAYGRVLASREPELVAQIPLETLIANSSPERREYYKKLPLHSMMLAPLQIQGEIIGVIGLGRHEPGKDYTSEDLTFLQDLADRSALAILNARLYKELEQELDEREALITELEKKNAELERFAYTVSHDLKSPLITINGYLGYLENDLVSGNKERLKHDSQRIQEAVAKMHVLLDDLLELSRVGRLMNPPEKVEFDELVREALDNVHGQIKANQISVNLEPDLPTVYGDRRRLIEVLQNLIENAAKFIGEQPNPKIEIGQRGKEKEMNVFFVRDNGVGIEPEYHERVFGLFEKLDSKSEGTGIGLSLVKRIIETHGGMIWIESEGMNDGATFLFTLANEPH